MSLNIIILAAGQGKRMCSKLPKVLHTLAGKPLLQRVVETAAQLHPTAIYVVYGHQGEQVRTACQKLPVQWVEQTAQLGTGHAVAQVLPLLNDCDQALILVGDTPLITAETLQKLIAATPANTVGLVTAILANPTGLGRVLRNADQKILGIVEEKDASETQRQIKEINTGIILAPVQHLRRWLAQVKNNNAQGEYYLPDIISMAVQEGISITTFTATSSYEVQGINDRAQLAELERYHQRNVAQQLMLKGVTLLDPQRFDLRGDLEIAADVTIDVNVIIEGKVSIGANSYIGPHSVLRNVIIGDNVTINSHCVMEDSEIGAGCIVGPFARLRPGAQLAAGAHIGNFVEVKKSSIGAGSKINHLSYIGDATIGQDVNIGAGTITCNYDGVNKHQTIIGDNVHIGSDTQLIAPVSVGAGATVAAGSTVAKDVPAGALTLTHKLEQRIVKDWRRPEKIQK